MAVAALVGRRVRERRLALGLRQAGVARAAGISAAYLNLIEHDRRRVGAEVLERLATALGVAPAALTGGQDAAFLDELRVAAAEGGMAAPDLALVEEVLSRFPAWAGLVVMQARRVAALERAVAALNDRIGQDPHLSAALHEVLSAASSVRSTAAILAESEEIDPDWRRRFHANLHQDSERLAAGAEALVGYLDGEAGAEVAVTGPQEEVEAWLAARGWHLAEEQAEEIAREVAALPSAAARALAGAHVAQAWRDAAVMPMEAVEQAAGDPLRLAAACGVGALAAMRRLATVPGAEMGLVVCDAAGALVFRKGVAGFPVPRGGAACALWPVFAALGRPGVAVEAVAEVPGLLPLRFHLRAFAEVAHPMGFGGPEVRQAGMLIAPTGAGGPTLAIGGTCRICPRAACPARREPSLVSEAALR